jgi:hypothetical protein
MKKSHPPYQQSSPSHGQFITLIAVLSVLQYVPRVPLLMTHVVILYQLIMEHCMSKIATALSFLLNGYSFNRFEVEHLGDHCLPSVFGALANKYVLTVIRTPEQIPICFGSETRVARSLSPPFEHDRAQQMFSMLKKRGRA